MKVKAVRWGCFVCLAEVLEALKNNQSWQCDAEKFGGIA
jgi:hypothetical protein